MHVMLCGSLRLCFEGTASASTWERRFGMVRVPLCPVGCPLAGRPRGALSGHVANKISTFHGV
eukprot:6621125-Prymnesium_polylepis.1